MAADSMGPCRRGAHASGCGHPCLQTACAAGAARSGGVPRNLDCEFSQAAVCERGFTTRRRFLNTRHSSSSCLRQEKSLASEREPSSSAGGNNIRSCQARRMPSRVSTFRVTSQSLPPCRSTKAALRLSENHRNPLLARCVCESSSAPSIRAPSIRFSSESGGHAWWKPGPICSTSRPARHSFSSRLTIITLSDTNVGMPMARPFQHATLPRSGEMENNSRGSSARPRLYRHPTPPRIYLRQ